MESPRPAPSAKHHPSQLPWCPIQSRKLWGLRKWEALRDKNNWGYPCLSEGVLFSMLSQISPVFPASKGPNVPHLQKKCSTFPRVATEKHRTFSEGVGNIGHILKIVVLCSGSKGPREHKKCTVPNKYRFVFIVWPGLLVRKDYDNDEYWRILHRHQLYGRENRLHPGQTVETNNFLPWEVRFEWRLCMEFYLNEIWCKICLDRHWSFTWQDFFCPCDHKWFMYTFWWTFFILHSSCFWRAKHLLGISECRSQENNIVKLNDTEIKDRIEIQKVIFYNFMLGNCILMSLEFSSNCISMVIYSLS